MSLFNNYPGDLFSRPSKKITYRRNQIQRTSDFEQDCNSTVSFIWCSRSHSPFRLSKLYGVFEHNISAPTKVMERREIAFDEIAQVGEIRQYTLHKEGINTRIFFETPSGSYEAVVMYDPKTGRMYPPETQLPSDVVTKILLELPAKKINDVCTSSKETSRLCTEDFWKRKYLRDFGQPLGQYRDWKNQYFEGHKIYSEGYEYNGRLGQGNNIFVERPTWISGSKRVTKIAVQDSRVLVLDVDGKMSQIYNGRFEPSTIFKDTYLDVCPFHYGFVVVKTDGTLLTIPANFGKVHSHRSQEKFVALFAPNLIIGTPLALSENGTLRQIRIGPGIEVSTDVSIRFVHNPRQVAWSMSGEVYLMGQNKVRVVYSWKIQHTFTFEGKNIMSVGALPSHFVTLDSNYVLTAYDLNGVEKWRVDNVSRIYNVGQKIYALRSPPDILTICTDQGEESSREIGFIPSQIHSYMSVLYFVSE